MDGSGIKQFCSRLKQLRSNPLHLHPAPSEALEGQEGFGRYARKSAKAKEGS